MSKQMSANDCCQSEIERKCALQTPNMRQFYLFYRTLIVIYSVFIIKRYKRERESIRRRVTDIFNVSTLVYATTH